MSIPRGIRNNNPLNIRRSKDKWKGMRAVQSDAQFCQFESLEWGWRIPCLVFLAKLYHHKCSRFHIYTCDYIFEHSNVVQLTLQLLHIQNFLV